jgi:hypothetical protein
MGLIVLIETLLGMILSSHGIMLAPFEVYATNFNTFDFSFLQQGAKLYDGMFTAPPAVYW